MFDIYTVWKNCCENHVKTASWDVAEFIRKISVNRMLILKHEYIKTCQLRAFNRLVFLLIRCPFLI